MTENLIVRQTYPNSNIREFQLRLRLCIRSVYEVQYMQKLKQEYVENLIDFNENEVQEIASIDGVIKLSIYPYTIRLEKSSAFSWKEVEDSLLKVLSGILNVDFHIQDKIESFKYAEPEKYPFLDDILPAKIEPWKAPRETPYTAPRFSGSIDKAIKAAKDFDKAYPKISLETPKTEPRNTEGFEYSFYEETYQEGKELNENNYKDEMPEEFR